MEPIIVGFIMAILVDIIIVSVVIKRSNKKQKELINKIKGENKDV